MYKISVTKSREIKPQQYNNNNNSSNSNNNNNNNNNNRKIETRGIAAGSNLHPSRRFDDWMLNAIATATSSLNQSLVSVLWQNDNLRNASLSALSLSYGSHSTFLLNKTQWRSLIIDSDLPEILIKQKK